MINSYQKSERKYVFGDGLCHAAAVSFIVRYCIIGNVAYVSLDQGAFVIRYSALNWPVSHT